MGQQMLRWVLLLACAALLQSVHSNPLPVADEEWEEYYSLLRDPNYRLPTSTVPRHYELSLTPYFDNPPVGAENFTFDGSVTIYINSTQPNVREIVMHCDDMTIHEAAVEYTHNDGELFEIASPGQTLECGQYSFLKISTTEDLQQNTEYTVRMNFTGRIQNNMRGFYRSWYIDSSGDRRWMGTTQFQPGHARQAFPCYDEPGFKATFDITINREEGFSPTISNMPIRSTGPVTEDGRVSETFYTTPKTSTYLLAFIVSHYVKIAEGTDESRPFDIYARDNANGTGEWSLEIGERLLPAMELYTQIPYYSMAEHMDMKQAAIPDFSAGAMENWGLLTYREALILYDPLNSNHFYRQRVANIVSHEIVHMWFGNLVTCAWWDNLWLNEGFARFYQYYLTNMVAPEMGYDTRFIVEQFQMAMTSDSVDSAHPLTDPTVNSPGTVSSHFSTITYARGAAVIRMTQHLLGNSTFVKGLQRYLSLRKYDVAEPHHLFEALDYAAVEDEALSAYGDVTIDQYFRSWSEKAGHPLLTVNIDQTTGLMTIEQSRWERSTGASEYQELWHIPITWTSGEAADFENLKPSMIMSTKTATIDRDSTANQWVVFNKQSSGFYRVNYDRVNWALITQALRSDVDLIHEYNRAQIIYDLFDFGRAAVLPYDRVFNRISFLEFDDQYAPWMAAVNGFEFLLRRVVYNEINTDKLQNLIIRLSGKITSRLGFYETQPGEYMDDLLRMYIMEFLCNIGHAECINAGVETFTKWRTEQAFVPANMRPWVYCAGLRNGVASDFDYFWGKFLEEDLASEQIVMIQQAGCTSDRASLEKFLEAIMDPKEIVRPQDLSAALRSAVTRNEENTLRVFDWLKDNVGLVTARLGSVTQILDLIAPRLLNEDDIEQFLAWIESNESTIGQPASAAARRGVEDARANREWSNERLPELELYFDTGYEDEETLPTTTSAPTTAETDAPITTSAPATTETDAPITTSAPTTADTDAPITTSAPATTETDAPITTSAPTTADTDAPITTSAPATTETDAPITTSAPTTADTDAPITTSAPTTDDSDAPTTTVAPTIPPTTEAATEEPTTPEDDGAATIALSIAAIVVSVALNVLN